MTLEQNIAWAAGLFEGEGSISLNPGRRNGRLYLQLQLQSTDWDVIERFHQIVGGALNPKARRRPGRKPIYTWTAASREARRILTEFAPFLGKRRSHRMREAQQFAWHPGNDRRGKKREEWQLVIF